MPGQSGGAVLQRQPVKPDKTAPLTLNIRIASSQNVVENADLSGPKKDLVKEISNDLRNQFLKHLQDRLAFLKSDKIKVTISFGQFADKDLKLAGNIQVWLVPELDQSFAAGAVMKKKYKYSDKAAQDVNAEFADDPTGGPGKDPQQAAGLTVGSTVDPKDAQSGRPIFVKLRESFVSRGGLSTDMSEYKAGRKVAAQERINDLATTTLHELGHLFGNKHTEGNLVPFTANDPKSKLKYKQSFPPKIMDTVSLRGRPVNDGHEVITKEEIEKLGGWTKFLKLLEHPSIKKAHLKGEDMEVWYDYSKLEFDEDQKTAMKSFSEFLRGAKNNGVSK